MPCVSLSSGSGEIADRRLETIAPGVGETYKCTLCPRSPRAVGKSCPLERRHEEAVHHRRPPDRRVPGRTLSHHHLHQSRREREAPPDRRAQDRRPHAGLALDPDELARLEFEPEHAAIIFKRPRNYSSEDQFLFKASSAGAFLFKDRLIIVVSDDVSLFDGALFTKAPTPVTSRCGCFRGRSSTFASTSKRSG